MKGRKPLRRNRPLRRGSPLKNKKPLERKTALSRGDKPLERKTPLKPGKPLKPGEPLRSKPSDFNKMPKAWRGPWAHWRATVTEVGVCAVCGRGPKAREPEKRVGVGLDPHHVIPARYIRAFTDRLRHTMLPREFRPFQAAVLFDVRNGLCLCRDCHEAHETGAERVPRELVPDSAVWFAREIGLERLIERFYP